MPAPTARLAAIQFAHSKLAVKLVYLDTETTGLGADAEIVEICVLDHDGRVLINTLVKSKSVIPPIVTRIHGITNLMVAKSPTWRDIWPDVAAALAGRLWRSDIPPDRRGHAKRNTSCLKSSATLRPFNTSTRPGC